MNVDLLRQQSTWKETIRSMREEVSALAKQVMCYTIATPVDDDFNKENVSFSHYEPVERTVYIPCYLSNEVVSLLC